MTIIMHQTTMDRFLTQKGASSINTSPPPINVFTDGSTIHNGKPYARGGYAAVFPEYPEYTTSKPLGHGATNNRAEYLACLLAFGICDVIDPTRHRTLVVYTDSNLLIQSLTKWLPSWKRNNWKKHDGGNVANQDLLVQLDTCMGQRNIVMRHVRAHTGKTDWVHHWNDIADKMAREATNPKHI